MSSSKSIRNSPSAHANDYCMQTMRGNDGKLYMSLPNKNMVCRWVKVSDKVINTDELYYKAVEMLGSKWDEFERTKVYKKGNKTNTKKNVSAKKKSGKKSGTKKSIRRKSLRKKRVSKISKTRKSKSTKRVSKISKTRKSKSVRHKRERKYRMMHDSIDDKITVQLMSGEQFEVEVYPRESNFNLYLRVWAELPEEIRASVPARVDGMALIVDGKVIPNNYEPATISQKVYNVFLDHIAYNIVFVEDDLYVWDIFLDSSEGGRELLGTLIYNPDIEQYSLAGAEKYLTPKVIIKRLMRQTDDMGLSFQAKRYVQDQLKVEIDQVRSKTLAAEIVSSIRSTILEQMEEQPYLDWDPWNEQGGGVAWLDNSLRGMDEDEDWSSYSSVEEIQKKLETMPVKKLKMIKNQLFK